MPDIFISYSSLDRSSVRRVVDAFERTGITIWWDQMIQEGRWGSEIEDALDNSDRVIAFISKNVAYSERYYVPAEMQRAQNQKKLIPLKVGEFTVPLMIEGIIFGEQLTFIKDFDDFLNGPHFRRICDLVRGRPEASLPVTAIPEWGWLETDQSVEKLSLATALAVAEGSPLAVVLEFSKEFERRLEAELVSRSVDHPQGDVLSFLSPRTTKLAAIGARRYTEKHARLGVDIECVRFDEPGRADETLARIWDEYDNIHAHLKSWLGHLSRTANQDARQRMGLTIGRLLRTHFASVHDALILPWIREEHGATRDVADMALAISVFDPALKDVIETIVGNFASSRDTTLLRAAVELACGYTGSQIKGLAIKTLKTVGESKHADFKVFDAMENSISFMVQGSLESDDNSLLNLDLLIGDLAEWAKQPTTKTPQRLPTFLFLSLMSRLPVRAPKSVSGRLSLEALTVNKTPRRATADVFNVALRDAGDSGFSPRIKATAILKRWMDAVGEDDDTDPLLVLARDIYANAPTDRDRDRLAFALRARYEQQDLMADIVEALPVNGADS
jgi:hypothetical protein